MTELVCLESIKEKKQYIRFVSSLYRRNEKSRDSLSRLLKDILLRKSVFCKSADVTPVAVRDESGNIIGAATFITAHKMRHILQIAFLEFSENPHDAFPLILAAARKKAREVHAEKIVAGLNGHVNNGLGFLVDHFDTPQSFGSPYNTPEYIEALKASGGVPDYQVSFLIDMAGFHEKWLSRLGQKTNTDITYRISDFRSIEREVRIYTDLNNAIFKGHPLYFQRDYEEDLELLKGFSWLIRGENFIVAEDRGKPVGFLLWYPDFNELIKKGGSLGLKTILKNKLFGNKISRFKIVEIGLLPEYQGQDVAWGLLKKCSDLTLGRYQFCETGWIFHENKKSRGLAESWEGSVGESIRLHKKYCVFYFDV